MRDDCPAKKTWPIAYSEPQDKRFRPSVKPSATPGSGRGGLLTCAYRGGRERERERDIYSFSFPGLQSRQAARPV